MRSWFQSFIDGDPMANLILVMFGLLITCFLPGYALVKSLFPRKEELDVEHGTIASITLGIGMSIVITILIGFVLGNPAVASFNQFWVITSSLIFTALFFALGWFRGAYPFMGKIHPMLERLPMERDLVEYEVGRTLEKQNVFEYQKLSRDKYRLRREIESYENKMRYQAKSISTYYERKRTEALSELKDIENKMQRIEGKKW